MVTATGSSADRNAVANAAPSAARAGASNAAGTAVDSAPASAFAESPDRLTSLVALPDGTLSLAVARRRGPEGVVAFLDAPLEAKLRTLSGIWVELIPAGDPRADQVMDVTILGERFIFQPLSRQRGHRGRPGDAVRRGADPARRRPGGPGEHRRRLPPRRRDGARALESLQPEPGGLLVIENVGNLVCPALFDLGERRKVVVISVTEGDDKPLKYPHMFAAADLVVLNKTDLLPYVDFDPDRLAADARAVNPAVQVLPVSARTGENLGAWFDWLHAQTLDS